jgi:hypothetical protein
LVYQEGNFEGLIDPEGRRYRPGEHVTCEMRFRSRFPSGTYSAQATVSWTPGEDTVRRSQSFLFYVDGRNPTMFGVADLEASFSVSSDSDLVPNDGPESWASRYHPRTE